MPQKLFAICVLFSGIVSADIVNISPTSIDFGAQPLGTTTSQSVTLVNPTKKLLNIWGVSVTGDFASPSNTCGGSLLPGQQCTITVTFRAGSLGIHTGMLSVDDDANNTPQKVKISGTGSPAVIQSISVSGLNSLKRGQTQQLTARSRYTDGSGQDITAAATWSTNAPLVATVNPAGLLTATGAGTAIIQASYASFTATFTENVPVPVLTGVAVTPTYKFGAPGVPQQFRATALYDNNLSQQDITNSANWQTSDPSNCQVGTTGLASCTRIQNAFITVVPPTPVSTNFGGNLEVSIQELFHGLNTGRYLHTATVLPDGRVLLAGGGSDVAPDGQENAEVYDPFYGSFIATGSMTTPRLRHSATLVYTQSSNKVLIAGGDTGGTAELYDPASGTFSPAGNLNVPRRGHTATYFGSGILLAGGDTATAEIYDQTTGVFTPTGSMATERHDHTATRLLNNKVLIAGGANAAGNLSTAELFDPVTGTFSPTASMASARADHTATKLSDGRVLIAGGSDGGTTSLSSTEIYDPATNTFSPGPAMSVARALHTATLLPDGTVFITGGVNESSSSPASAEIMIPSFGPYKYGNLATPNSLGVRIAHTATMIGSKQILITGGYPGSASTQIAELYLIP
jgi:hypothetical protein